jgi:serine/threonine-protein kinase
MGESTPATLGRYVVEEEIGRGMMGAVYRASDPDLGRTVALKTVRLAFPVSDRERDQFQERFQREARAAGALSHANIVVVHDVGRDPESGTLFIALEYLEGRTVEQIVSDGPMDWSAALRIVAHLADALHHAHSRGIIHRDIKPANIMVLEDGEPKIMDFGIAKLPASQLTVAGQFFGTPAYTAPEQVTGTEIDGRADLFALGAILYLLLTGQRAFTGSSVPAIVASVQSKDPVPPSAIVSDLPEAVDYVVRRALAKDRDKRYPDGRTLADDLEDLCAGQPPRHRAGWVPPVPADATMVSATPAVPPKTEPPLVVSGASLEPVSPANAVTAAAERPSRAPAVRAAFVPKAAPARSRGLGWVGPALGAAAAFVVVGVLAVGLWIGSHGAGPAPAPPSAETAVGARPPSEPGGLPVEATEPPPRVPLLPSFLKPVTPAGLDIDVDHSLKNGRLRVWLDDELVLDEALRGRVKKKILVYKRRAGHIDKTLEIEPGDHTIIVRVDADGDVLRERISARFESGATRHLVARIGGLLRKHLELSWSRS